MIYGPRRCPPGKHEWVVTGEAPATGVRGAVHLLTCWNCRETAVCSFLSDEEIQAQEQQR